MARASRAGTGSVEVAVGLVRHLDGRVEGKARAAGEAKWVALIVALVVFAWVAVAYFNSRRAAPAPAPPTTFINHTAV